MRNHFAAYFAGIFVGFLPFLINPDKAHAQECVEYGTVAEQLKTFYGQTARIAGLTVKGHTMQVFTNPESKTWTYVEVRQRSNGRFCAVIRESGGAFTDHPNTGSMTGERG